MKLTTCERCLEEFTFHMGRPPMYCAACRVLQARDRARAWAVAHPDQVAERRSNYYRENRDRILAQNKQWAADNPDAARAIKERHYQANREECIERARQYVLADRERARTHRKAAKRKRRARKMAAEGSHTQAEFLNLCDENGWACCYCGEALTPETATRDHVIPLVRGGSDRVDNLVPACLDCNRKKARRTAEEFLAL